MQLPLQVTFRHIQPSEALEARIRKESTKLERFSDHIMSCRVVVEAAHKHHHQGNLYRVRIDLTVPGGEVVVSHDHHDRQDHEDAYVAVRDAFNAAQRQLEDFIRNRRGDTKFHEMPAHGRIAEIFPYLDYGTISTPDNREIYFHRNSVLEEAFDKLEVGMEVRFVEHAGEKGPQASTVQIVGKHHPAGV